ncbi:MAG TPA: uroporphyrinogen-III synthase [Noviherbaspirillum sp.]|nr:uroporphyrinogen-III synthase [Noviherbaspirillum sp.]
MSASALPVVVTRPAAMAQPLADGLRAAGRDAVVLPLLEIVPIEDATTLRECLARLDTYALVVFVSPSAIDIVLPMIASWPASAAVAVVGEGSRRALARHGVCEDNARIFSPCDPQRSDSETLLQVLDLEALRGRRVLILRGDGGRELLGDALRGAGAQVEQVTAYRRRAPIFNEARRELLQRLLDGGAIWLITSSEALRVLTGWVRDAFGAAGLTKLQAQRLIVPHPRIAETAGALGFSDITQTASGDEHLLAALQSRP